MAASVAVSQGVPATRRVVSVASDTPTISPSIRPKRYWKVAVPIAGSAVRVHSSSSNP